MPRAKGGPKTRQRRKKVLKKAKGYFGGRRKLFRTAKETVLRAGVFAYRDRCSACTGTLSGAQLSAAVLRCPNCGAGFDVVHVRNFNYPPEAIPSSVRWAAHLLERPMRYMPWSWQFVLVRPA